MRKFATACLFVVAGAPALAQNRFPGFSFAGDSTVFVPLRQVGEALGYPVGFASGKATLAYRPVQGSRSLLDGTTIVPARAFEKAGAHVSWDPDSQAALIETDNVSVEVVEGKKRVVIDKTHQVLKAYQGDVLVLTTPISTGREGHRTPNGTFSAGPLKTRMHRSKLYDDAPMPWSIQVDGNIFLHGYATVPDIPASHGCIRLPTDGANPAKWLYKWIDMGTPIIIQGKWNASGREGAAS